MGSLSGDSKRRSENESHKRKQLYEPSLNEKRSRKSLLGLSNRSSDIPGRGWLNEGFRRNSNSGSHLPHFFLSFETVERVRSLPSSRRTVTSLV